MENIQKLNAKIFLGNNKLQTLGDLKKCKLSDTTTPKLEIFLLIFQVKFKRNPKENLMDYDDKYDYIPITIFGVKKV